VSHLGQPQSRLSQTSAQVRCSTGTLGHVGQAAPRLGVLDADSESCWTATAAVLHAMRRCLPHQAGRIGRGGQAVTFKDDVISARDEILSSSFSVRAGSTVPTTEDVGYNEAVKLSATYLYADMVDSSGLVAISPKETVGKVLRLYLDLSVRIIRREGGHIRSFDGDRVMGIFIDADRCDAAVRAAMKIK
jgi:hypothetical protein